MLGTTDPLSPRTKLEVTVIETEIQLQRKSMRSDTTCLMSKLNKVSNDTLDHY